MEENKVAKVITDCIGEALKGKEVIRVVLPDVPEDIPELYKKTIPVGIDVHDTGFGLESLSDDQEIILLVDILQNVENYRGLIQVAFSRLKTCGKLVITVPHQFLRERKFRLPSRYKTGALRFYSPATLLMEIEEALPPAHYRIRAMHDDDEGYEYSAPLDRLPTGHQDIIVMIEKIVPPAWADDMQDGDPCDTPYHPTHVLPLSEKNPSGPLNVISPTSRGVGSVMVLKLDHLGDQIIAEAAFAEIRAQFPDAKVTLVCGSWNVAAARKLDLFDDIVPFNIVAENASEQREHMSPEDWVVVFRKLMAGRSFDLALDLSMHSKTRALLKGVTARHKGGFDRWNEFPWLDIRLTLPVPSMEGAAERGIITAQKFMTKMGLHKGYAIDFAASDRHGYEDNDLLIWGGYSKIPAGDYRFDFAFEAEMKQDIGYRVRDNNTNNMLASGIVSLPVSDGRQACIFLSLPDGAEELEFMFHAVDQGPLDFRFSGVLYERPGVIMGIHQSESQVLLVRLAALRLVNPYQHTVHVS